MPNLAFSPGPQQPRSSGGEKENALAADAVGNKSVVDPSARRRSSGGDGSALGRSPLEKLSPDMASSEASHLAAAAAAAAVAVPVGAPAVPPSGGVVACKRNSSCKCPDCDMAASVFGIDQLRQVGGGGGVARSPVGGVAPAAAVARSPPPAPVGDDDDAVGGDDDRALVPDTPVAGGGGGGGGGGVAAIGEEDVGTPGRLVGVAEAEAVRSTPDAKLAATTPTSAIGVSDVEGTAVVEQATGGVPAAAGGGSVAKKGWGFRMARAVFSPAAAVLTPMTKKKKDETGYEMTDTTVDGAAQETSEAVAASSVRSKLLAGLVASPKKIRENDPENDPENVQENTDDLLSGGDEEGEVGGNGQAVVAGGTVEAPMVAVAGGVESGGAAVVIEEAVVEAGMGAMCGKGERSTKRSAKRTSSGRRLSKDVFFECSSEVEHVLASESESDSDNDQSEGATPVERSIAFSPTDRRKVAMVTSPSPPTPSVMAGSSPQRPVGTNGPDPAAKAAIEAAVAAAAAVVAAGDVQASGTGAVSDPSTSAAAGVGAPASIAVVPRDEVAGGMAVVGVGPAAAPAAGVVVEEESKRAVGATVGAVRAVVGAGGGRRRIRRAAPELGLGAEAYGHEDNRSKFSQAEVNAKIRERLAEEQAAFDKTVSAMKAEHEEELKAAAERLRRSSSDGNRAKMAARDTEALEREIAMLSERFGEAAAEAMASGKALGEKEALLDAVTAQLMGLKVELKGARESFVGEKQAMLEEVDMERRNRGVAEGRLAQLAESYNRLEDTEREKRAAGILKMKKDMQALAQAQFGEANKKHNIVKARLDSAEAEVRQLREAAKGQDSRMTAAREQTEELRRQAETLRSEQANNAADAARKEQLLQEEIVAVRAEAESKMNELEAMSRERDSANNGRDVSQDALARMAIRNTELKESVSDLEGKVKELEGFCTEALDELDREKALRVAAGK